MNTDWSRYPCWYSILPPWKNIYSILYIFRWYQFLTGGFGYVAYRSCVIEQIMSSSRNSPLPDINLDEKLGCNVNLFLHSPRGRINVGSYLDGVHRRMFVRLYSTIQWQNADFGPTVVAQRTPCHDRSKRVTLLHDLIYSKVRCVTPRTVQVPAALFCYTCAAMVEFLGAEMMKLFMSCDAV